MFKKRSSKPKSLIKLIFLGVVVLVTLLGFVIFTSDLFKVKNIELSVANLSCVTEETLKFKLNLYGSNLILLSSVDNLKDKFFCIKDIRTQKIFPNSLKIEITGRLPKATLILAKFRPKPLAERQDFAESTQSATPSSRLALINTELETGVEKYLLDEEGFVFAEGSSSQIPEILVESLNIKVGNANSNFVNALKVISKMNELSLNLSRSKIIYYSIFVTEGDKKILFRLDKNIDRQLASLQLILQKDKISQEIKMKKKEIEIIDLRFDKPVVVYFP